MRAALAGLLLVLSASGCRFDDTAVPGSRITCAKTEECPTGWRCSLARGVCLPPNVDDTVAPSLSATVSPSLVRPGDTVEITLSANEALAGQAEVEVRARGVTRATTPGEGERFSFEVPAVEPDGLLTFYGRAEDLAGNVAEGALLGSTVVDGTPPTARLWQVTPARAAPGALISVQASLSEEVRAGARLVVREASGTEHARSETTASTSTPRFEFTTPAGADGLRLQVSLEGLVDVAGNTGEVTPLGEVVLDAVPPTVGPLGLAGRRYSARPGHDELLVPIDVTGADRVQACLAGRCLDAADAGLVRFAVTSSDGEGLHLAAVRAWDEVGQLAEVSEPVTFDFSPPALRDLRVSPPVVAAGGIVAVTATFDEVLASGAELVVEGAGGWTDRVTSSQAGGNLALFTVRLPQASLPSGPLALRVEGVTDLVANPSPALDAGTFTLDADPPVFGAAGAGVSGRYSRQPGHDVVSVPPPVVTGAQRVEVCVAGRCVDADGGTLTFTVGANDVEGSQVVSLGAFDEVGNAATEFGFVTYDFTAPVLQDLRVSPPRVAPGGVVSVTASFDEVLASGAELVVQGAGGWTDRVPSTQSGSNLALFTVLLPQASLPSGALTLRVEGVADVVANAAPAVDAGTFTLDADPPVFGASGVGVSGLFSRQPGFDVVTVPPPNVTGAQRVEVCIDKRCVQADGGATTFAIGPTDVEGGHVVTLGAFDEVGNVATEAGFVTYDFSAPVLQDLLVSPPVVGPGGVVAVTATFDEVLAAGAALVVEANGGWSDRIESTQEGSNLASFTVRLPQATLPSGPLTLRVEGIADAVANAAPALDAGTFTLDADPPVFGSTGPGVSGRYSRQPGFNVVTVPPPSVTGAARVEVCLDARCVEADGGAIPFTVGTSDVEGGHVVTTRAFDAVGNVATQFGFVTYDFSPPQLLFSDLRYTPPPGCPLQTVSALAPQAGVTVQLTTDEPLGTLPSMDAGVLAFAVTQGDAGAQAFSVSAIGPGTLATGTIGVVARLVDTVGNAVDRPVTSVLADVTPPAALTPTQADLFQYTRVPFGAESTNFQERYTIASDAGVFEPNLLVQLFTSGSSTGQFVASTTTTDAGAFPLTQLPPVDYPKLYFKAYDPACNSQPSGTGAAPVPRMEWVITLGTKIPGQRTPNPHRFYEEYGVDFGQEGTGELSREWGDAELARPDDAGASSSSPALIWQETRPAPGTARCLVRDLETQEVTFVGDHTYRRGPLGWVREGDVPASVALQANCADVEASPLGRPAPVGLSRGRAVALRNGTWKPIGEDTGLDFGWLVGGQGPQTYALVDGEDSIEVYAGDAELRFRRFVATPPPGRALTLANVGSYRGAPLVVAPVTDGGVQETWLFQDLGSSGLWTREQDAPAVPQAMAELGTTGGLVMVGVAGSTPGAWRFSAGAWSSLPPCPLAGTVIAGLSERDGTALFINDALELATFDGSDWIVHEGTPPLWGYREGGFSPDAGLLAPSIQEKKLLFYAMALDGGKDTTMVFDGASWRNEPGVDPSLSSAAASVEGSNSLLLVGLSGTTGYAWSRTTSGWKSEVAPPGARRGHALALDANKRVVMTGGYAPGGTSPLDTWGTWDGSWTAEFPLLQLARAFHAMGYDPVRGVTVLFGGTGQSPLNDTWEWNGATWSNRSQSTAPSARTGAALTWDPVREVMMLHGGNDTTETWRYDGEWTELTRFVRRPPGAGLVSWDPTTNTVVSLSGAGEALLGTHGRWVTQRFEPETPDHTWATPLVGRLVTSVAARGAGPISALTNTGGAWVPLGAANSTLLLSPSAVSDVLIHGVRLAAPTSDPSHLKTDYVELSVRYQVNN